MLNKAIEGYALEEIISLHTICIVCICYVLTVFKNFCVFSNKRLKRRKACIVQL